MFLKKFESKSDIELERIVHDKSKYVEQARMAALEILKGRNRPILSAESRAIVLAAFSFVDAVIIFTEETPANLIAQIIPDVLAKGNQYKIHEIAGFDTVLANGGKVVTIELVPGISTSDIIDKIKTLD